MYLPYTGVPRGAEKFNHFISEYRMPAQYPNWMTRTSFIYAVVGYSALFFIGGGAVFSDFRIFRDPNGQRADFNGYRPMVSAEYIPIEEIKQVTSIHGSYFDDVINIDPRSSWVKIRDYLWPEFDYRPSKYESVPFHDYRKDYVTSEFNQHYHK